MSVVRLTNIMRFVLSSVLMGCVRLGPNFLNSSVSSSMIMGFCVVIVVGAGVVVVEVVVVVLVEVLVLAVVVERGC